MWLVGVIKLMVTSEIREQFYARFVQILRQNASEIIP